MNKDRFKLLREFVVRLGYVPREDCRHMVYPSAYCKDNFTITFSLWNIFGSQRLVTVVDFFYNNGQKMEPVATTNSMTAFRYHNIPMPVMKNAIRNPSRAFAIFNNWETEKTLQIL